jgi:hypothetical protein
LNQTQSRFNVIVSKAFSQEKLAQELLDFNFKDLVFIMNSLSNTITNIPMMDRINEAINSNLFIKPIDSVLLMLGRLCDSNLIIYKYGDVFDSLSRHVFVHEDTKVLSI